MLSSRSRAGCEHTTTASSAAGLTLPATEDAVVAVAAMGTVGTAGTADAADAAGNAGAADAADAADVAMSETDGGLTLESKERRRGGRELP